MATIALTNVIAGAVGGVLPIAGPPSAGMDEVQTLTIGGTPTGGTFTLVFEGYETAAIAWSATNATLLANIDAALEALPNVGTGGVAAAAGTLTAGIGTVTLTFGGNRTRQAVATITVGANDLTGTAPTLAVAETTPGVDASFRGVGKGVVVTDTTNALVYTNTGTALAPTWTKVGTQV